MSLLSMAYLFTASSFTCAIVQFAIGIRLLKKPRSYLYNTYTKTAVLFYGYFYGIIMSIYIFKVLPYLSIPLFCLNCYLLLKTVIKIDEFEIISYLPNLDDNLKEVLEARNLKYEHSKTNESSLYQIEKPNLTLQINKKTSWVGPKISYTKGSDKKLYYSILDEMGESKLKLQPISAKRCLFIGIFLAIGGCVILFLSQTLLTSL